MPVYHEVALEESICEYLAAHGWLYSPDDTGYDSARALFPADVLGWLAETQPESTAKSLKLRSLADAADPDALLSPHLGDPEAQRLLDSLVKALDHPVAKGGGTLQVLRHGFRHLPGGRRPMCQFKPATGLNPQTLESYRRVRLRVMRQVHFSLHDQRSLDLVLFVNGIPVATVELKTDFTQSTADAMAEYRTRRHPRTAGHREPLLTTGARALVHFAMDNETVQMTTDLRGEDTVFLPFNRGSEDDGAGNPENPGGSRTSYMWERIWNRDAWLDILGNFIYTEPIKQVSRTGAVIDTGHWRMVFPRFHQWEAVTAMLADARLGPGRSCLIQHSAGSGKTNSIAWLANRLISLHGADDQKVFDSVIVVTDRNVLDDQLREAVQQISDVDGVVVTVGPGDAARSGTSKSGLLGRALTAGGHIIVVTLQTFPYVMEAITRQREQSAATDPGLGSTDFSERTYAIVVDEAHSSQTGGAAQKLREVLSHQEMEELEDGGEYDINDWIAATAASRADSSHLSYFAFTATPKPRTLEMFGRSDGAGHYRPFHTYSMKQAIAEGFILDVLRGYVTYREAYEIANPHGDTMVDEKTARRGVIRWVELHPTNIGQKVQIIVEHFRANVGPLLDGRAKAMVVTDSRKAAVRYKLAIDRYIRRHHYDIGTLVAFSGSVDDEESGSDSFSEGSMNPRGTSDIRSAFDSDDYRILLVANKFQTGFDQPLLCAMYVDKKLSGVAAVQTLSRLNRPWRQGSLAKDSTFVLDFVNRSEDIQAAFEPFYADAMLDGGTDPNILALLQRGLATQHIYTDDEIEQCAEAWMHAERDPHPARWHHRLSAAVSPAKHRYSDRFAAARDNDDQAELQVLEQFRSDAATFVRLHQFLSQIIDLGDPELEKLAIFLRLLVRTLDTNQGSPDIDLADMRLVAISHRADEAVDIHLGTEEPEPQKPQTGAGSRGPQDPHEVALREIIDQINERFAGAFSEPQQRAAIDSLVQVVAADPLLQQIAASNTPGQLADSPEITRAIQRAVYENADAQARIGQAIAGNDALLTLVRNLIVEALLGRDADTDE